MSAKDTADAILRDFRTSMADTCTYRFETYEMAAQVREELGHFDWLHIFSDLDVVTISVRDTKERKLSI